MPAKEKGKEKERGNEEKKEVLSHTC